MTERSFIPTATSRSSTGPALLPSLSPLLTEWLPRQRWFAGTDRLSGRLSLVTATELLPCLGPAGSPPSSPASSPAAGLLHLLVRIRRPNARHDTYDGDASPDTGASGHADCYQLLLGVRHVLPPHLAAARIGVPSTGPLRGQTVYEALHDPRLCRVLLERLRTPGRLGTLRFVHGPGATTLHVGLPPRLLETEQSNSSVVYGSSYILKVFRRVDPGVNPDLELPLALAEGGCRRVPRPIAWFEAEPEYRRHGQPRQYERRTPGRPAAEPRTPAAPPRLTLGVLQPFLPGCGDGWQLALGALATGHEFTSAARALGRATAEVHEGLASALPTTVLQRDQLKAVARAMATRLSDAATAVAELRPYHEGLRGTFHALEELAHRGHTLTAQRVHGDLHLGQTLHSTEHDGWSLIDFEGEPARPLAERREPQPVARDIAGMLRSFDYAACQQGVGQSRALDWAADNRAAYCQGYADVAGVDPRDDAVLLRAFETDKAIYEVLYEARHRPTWLPIPLSAIRRLARAAPVDI